MSYQLEGVVERHFLVRFLVRLRSADVLIQSPMRTFMDLQFWSNQLSNMALIYHNTCSILAHQCHFSSMQQSIVGPDASLVLNRIDEITLDCMANSVD